MADASDGPETAPRTDFYDADDYQSSLIAVYATYANDLRPGDTDHNKNQLRALLGREEDLLPADYPDRDLVINDIVDDFGDRYDVLEFKNDESGLGMALLYDKHRDEYKFTFDGTEVDANKASPQETINDGLADIYIAFGDELEHFRIDVNRIGIPIFSEC